MKKISEINRCINKLGKQISTFLAFMFVSTMALAQRAVEEKDPATAEFNYDMRDNPWYTQPRGILGAMAKMIQNQEQPTKIDVPNTYKSRGH